MKTSPDWKAVDWLALRDLAKPGKIESELQLVIWEEEGNRVKNLHDEICR